MSATGLRRAAGIGGGCGYGFDTIDITNAKIRAVAVFGAGIGVSASKLYDDDADIISSGNISITNSTTFAASVAGGAGIGGGIFARADSITIRGGTTIAQGGSSYVHKKGVEIYGADQLNKMLSEGFSEGFDANIPSEITDALGFLIAEWLTGGWIFGGAFGDFIGGIIGDAIDDIVGLFTDKGDTIYYAGAGIGCGHGADGGTINILDRAYVQAYDGRTDHDDCLYSFAIGSGKFKDNNTAITIYDEAMVTHGKMDPIGDNKFTPVELGVTTASSATAETSGILRNRELSQYAVISPGTFRVPVVKEWGNRLVVPFEVSVEYSNTYYMDPTTNVNYLSETATNNGSIQLNKLKDWREEVVLRPQGTVSLREAKANGFAGDDWEQSWRLEIHYEKPVTTYDEQGNVQSVGMQRYDFAVKPSSEIQDAGGPATVFSFQRREDLRTTDGTELTEDQYKAVMSAFAAQDGSATFVLTNTHRKTYSVQKNWLVDDAGQYKPASVDVALQQKQDDGTWKTLQPVTLSEANEWKTSFDPVADLGDDKYRVRETYNDGIVYNKGDSDIADGATQVNTYTYKGLQIGGKPTDVAYDVTYETDATGLTTITNTWQRPNTITVHGRKIWVDNENSSKTRPEKLNIYLMADGAVVRTQEITPDQNNYWGWTFEGLPSTNAEGKAIAYTVTEDVPDGYTGVAAGKRLENVKVEEGSSEAEPADGQHIDVQNYDLANVLENRTIRGRKIWVDNKNDGNTRPRSLTVRLMADGVEKSSQIVTPDDNGYWGWTFEDLPRTNSEGKTIKYTVTEDKLEGYASVAAGQRVEGAAVADGSSEAEPAAGYIDVQDYDLANVLVGSTLTISGRKIWVDNENSSKTRPRSLTVRLMADGVEKSSQIVTPDDNGYWGWTFEDLPRTNSEGKTIKYTVTEDKLDGYTSIAAGQRLENVKVADGSSEAVSENGQHIDVQGYDLANVLVDDPLTAVDISGRKIWVDNKNSDNKRPSKLNIHLLADGVEVRSQVVKPDKNNYWGWTFKGLPRTNDKGQAITYTVTEGVPSGYTCVAAGQRLENVRVEEGSSEAEPADDEHIDVQGYDLANVPVNSPGVGPVDPGDDPGDPGVDPDDDDDDKPIIPIVPIVPIEPIVPVPPVPPVPDLPGPPEEEVKEEDKDKDEDEDDNQKVNIKVTKVWDDNDNKGNTRPTSVTVKLLADGIVKKTATLKSNSWTTTFQNLPKKVSKESQVPIVYTVTEDPVKDYTTKIERDNMQDLSTGSTCYKITNTYKDNSEKETYSVKKVWNIDAAGQDRPSVLKAVLQKQASPVSWETAKDERGEKCIVELSAANNWEAEFPAVKKKEDGKTIKYRIRELDKDESVVYARGDHDYQKYISKYLNEYVLRKMSALDSLTVLDCGDHLSEYLVKYAESGTRTTITNTAVMEIGIKKFWLGANKPAENADIWNSIYLMLMSRPKAAAGGESVPYTPVYNALFGDALDGDAALNQVAGFFNAESVLSVLTMATGFHASDYINYGLAAAKATEDNGWQVKFGVPKYDALGQEQEYMGAEVVTGILSMAVKGVTGIDTPVMVRPIDPKFVSVFGYAMQVPVLNKDYQRSCYVINTWLDPGSGDPDTVIGGVKYWDDGDSSDRPSEVVLHVYAIQGDGSKNDVKGSPITVKASDGWVWSLPLTKENLGLKEGDVISIEEVVPDGYEPIYNGFDIINRKKSGGDPGSETRDITVTKVWDDGNNKDGIRPANVRITVRANDKVVKNVVLDESNNWTSTVTGLPKKGADGNDIVYKLEEEKTDVLTGTDSPWTYKIDVSGNADAGYVFTNKHTPADSDSQTKSLTVKKEWDDNNNQDGLRPSYVKVALKATMGDATTTVRTVTLDAFNNWRETVANLPTKWGGKQIEYAWEEVVPGGYTSVRTVDGDTTTIKNTHGEETTSVGVRKIWKHNDNKESDRPSQLTVRLFANGVQKKEITLSASGGTNADGVEYGAWNAIVNDLPKYRNGREIQYTWSEGDLPAGYTLTNTSVSGGVTTFTNTYNATSTSASVSKVWDDNGDAAGKRPDYVVMALYRKYNDKLESAPIKRLRLRAGSGWKATVSNLPLLYTDNTPVGYEWVEEPFDDGYELASKVVSGNMTIFTNAVKRSITVSKVWDDEADFDGIRPSTVTVNLYANGAATGKSVTLSESDSWTGTFDDLPATKDGAAIVYTVAEQKTGTIAGKDGVGTYSSTVSGTADSGFTITNVHTPEKTSVAVTKRWDDANDQDGKRPASVTVRLLANGVEARSATIAPTSGETQSYTFTNLPVYQGTSKIDYTVAEDAVDDYKTEVSGSASGGYTIKNTHKPETTSVSASKVWDDNNDQDGKRPSSVTVTLSAKVGDAVVEGQNGKTLTIAADAGWRGTFTDLPKYQGGKEVVYAVAEDAVDGYTAEVSATDKGFTITNTHTPETRSVKVTKVWDHGNNQDTRPTSAIVNLYADGEAVKDAEGNARTLTLSETNQWHGSFSGLPKYRNGREVVYTVTEDAAADYTTSVTGNQNKGFTFTNTYTPNKTQINVHKVWDDADDQDGIRPSSVEVALYKHSEHSEDDSSRSITLNAANGWSGTFSGLDPVSGNDYYFVEEEDLPDGYTYEVSPRNSADGSRDFTITNKHTPQTTSVKVDKIWYHEGNPSDKHPNSVNIRLYANGTQVKEQEISADSDGKWSHTFTGLPTYEDGTPISYTVTEDAVPNYTTAVTGNAQKGFIVANTYSPNMASVRVVKRWDDANNRDGKRPGSVEVRLVADGKETTNVLRLSAANGWSGTFGAIPAKDEDGKAIDYTVTEQAVPGYTTTYEGDVASGFVITNSHAPQKTSVAVTKSWDDNENQDGVRPEAVTVYLLANGVRTGQSMELKANNDADKNWKGTFANLPASKAGNAITYGVEEEAVAGYTSATSYSEADGYTITNTHVPQTVDVSGTKTWVGDNNTNTRPKSITVKLLANGTEVESKTVDTTSADGQGRWTWTFAGKPKYANGETITYTVSEDEVPGYETTYDRKHLNVTNTYVPTTTVTVKKEWAQETTAADSVNVRLYANGRLVGDDVVVLNAGNNWTKSFENLPKYKNGTEIVYTVTEDAIAGYTSKVKSTTAQDGSKTFTITNDTSDANKTQISVVKRWDDDNNRDGIRPKSVTVKLLANGVETGEPLTLNAANDWSDTFSGLETGKNYTVKEQTTGVITGTDGAGTYAISVDGNATEGYIITNKHTPEVTSVSGTKTWDDANNQDGLRPSSITVRLLAGGKEVDYAEVKPDSNGDWKWNFTNLPKYDGVNESGQPKEIKYTVTENTVPGYTTAYKASDGTTATDGAPNGGTITNRRDPEKTSVKVTKKWDDDNNRDGLRPEFVTVRLQKNGSGEVGTATLSASNNWTHTFANLDAIEGSQKITYTVTENAVEGYGTKYDGDASKGYTIINTHKPETTSVSGSKTWHDADNQDGIRPSSITVRLLANGTEVDRKVVRPDANGNWSWTFADMPKYDGLDESGNHKEIVYAIAEDEVADYTPEVKGYNVTNTHTPETRSVKVTKVWDHGSNQGTKPTSAIVNLYADGAPAKDKSGATVEAATLSADRLTHTFTNLPKYKNGREIVYTVAEDAVTDYVATVTGDQNSGFTITNTYKPGKTQVNVRKVWDDANDQDGIRPSSVTVKLLKNDVETGETLTLNAGNGWSGTFTELDATGTYTVKEKGLPVGYTSAVTPENSTEGKDFTITNTHTTGKTSVKVTKTWVDAEGTGSTPHPAVTIRLYANGTQVGTHNVAAGGTDSWTHEFTNLPTHQDGEKIAYTISEDAVEGYTTAVEGNAKDGFTVTNTATTGDNKTQINVVKRWDDANNQDGIRPNSVVVRLVADGKATANTLTLSADNNWSGTFQNLAVKAGIREIAYTVLEQPVLGYAATYSGDVTTGFAIVNAHTPQKTSVKVAKKWDDANDQDGKRPASVWVYLLADGVRTGQSIELKANSDTDKNWKGSFDNLAANKAGKAIEYTVEEETIAGYTSVTSGNAANGYTITNTHTPETIPISGSKRWDDANDQDGLRPRTITVRLKKKVSDQSFEEVASQTVSASSAKEEGEWTWTFDDVPKYANGSEIEYTVTEDKVEGYNVPEVTGGVTDGFSITNRHEPQTVDVSGKKIWNDDNDRDGIRPSSITIRLLADGREVDHKVVRPDANGKWSWTFSRVAKYRAGTTEAINYAISEDKVEGYEATVDGYNVTNTHSPATTDVAVKKVWDDDNNAEKKRPESVTFHLYADGKEVTGLGGNALTLTLPNGNSWSDSFTGLPKYKNGREIVYTVTEEAIADYATTVAGNANDGFTVTNKYAEGKTQVSVHKVWEDADDQDGIRPDEVEVELKNGDTVVAKQKLNAGNNWSHTFTGLDAKDSSGTKISYTVAETSVPKGYTTDDEPAGDATQGYTITNRHTPQNTNVLVKKVWDDAGNEDKRPESVTVRLYANGRLVDDDAVMLSAESWSHKFANLPKYENGTEIAYTVTEDTVVGYTSKVESKTNADVLNPIKTFTITNKATTGDNKTQVNVTKRWDDANDQDGLRPNVVVVSLWADGRNTGRVLLLSAANGWSGAFANLDVTAGDGAPIKYTISELPTPGYASVISGDATQGFAISNSYTPQKTSVKVAKQWDDANDQDGMRPDSVTVHLLADGARTGKTVELNASNNWSGTFGDLARRKAGTDIAYTVEEETNDVITGEDKPGTYEVEVSGTAADGYTITNTHTPETIPISGSKRWDDAENQDGKRPKSIKIRLIANGSQIDAKDVKPSKDGSWTWDFGRRPKYKDGREIEYRIEEDGISGYTTTYNGFNVTNTHVPETTSVSVKKTWVDDNNRDGIRPASVRVRLSAKVGDEAVEHVDGTEETLEKSGNWSATFANLPKYQGGKEVTYTVSETSVPAGYTADEPAGSAATGFTITNTHTPERTNILVKKVWDDEGNQNARPASVTFRLYANGAERRTFTRNLSDWDGTVSARGYKYENGREIEYTLTEDAVDGYTTAVAREKSNDGTTFTVTNTHAPTRTQVSVHKVWDDDNNRDGVRPESVTVKLLANGTETGGPLTLDASNGWGGTFGDLRVKDNSDNKIVYTVEEQKTSVITGTDGTGTYAISTNGDAERGFTITNTHTPDKVNIAVTKVWDDNNDQDGKRPSAVTIRLYADGEEVASKQIDASSANEEGKWTWTFANLPKYDGVGESDNPKEIAYTVTEDQVSGYTTTYKASDGSTVEGGAPNGGTITNTHEPETTAVIGHKVWDDSKDQAGGRPTSIQVTLHASPAPLSTPGDWTKTVTAADNWTWSWTDLPKYQGGQQIAYTVTEKAIGNYTTTYMGPNVINTYAEDKTSVRVTKVWSDANNQDGIRPDEVVVSLYANGRYTGKVLRLHAAGNWAGVFSDLPAKDGDSTINYTVRERAIDGYTTIYGGSATEGFVITNTHIAETTNIPVRKVWNDSNDAEHARPKSVKVYLLADGVRTGPSLELSADNGWKGSFNKLAVNKAGAAIDYGVEEEAVEDYTSAISGSTADGFTVTNAYVPETINIVGAKTWNDQGHEDKRPASITVRLYANGREVASQEVRPTKDGAWNYGFYNQPKREAGADIVYTVSEDAVPNYTATTSGHDITNTYTEGKMQVSVHKAWDDDNNRDGIRPDSVSVTLKNGDTTVGTASLSASNQWSHTFDVPNAAGTYTVEENQVADYDKPIVTGDATKGFTITNKHEPSKTSVNIPVTVIYDDAHDQDGLRGEVFPTKVPVTNRGADTGIVVDVKGNLTGEGSTDKWSGSFTYSKYNNEDLSGLEVAPTTSKNYIMSVAGDASQGFTITYKHEPQTTQVQVNKVWDDQGHESKRPADGVTVRLYADGATAKNGSGNALTATMAAANSWSATFGDLPKYRAGKEIDYTISEDTVDNYASSISGPELSDGVSKYRVYTVTNTYTEGKTQVNVHKVWDDDNDRDGIRPSSVTVKLKEGDTVTDNALTLSEANGWTGTFSGLAVSKDGTRVTYGVEEDRVEGYEPTIQSSGTDGRDFTITNKHTSEKVNVVIEKKWNDQAGANRPDSITLRLYADGEQIRTYTRDASNWDIEIHEELPKLAGGHEIVYTVTEDTVPGYSSAVGSGTSEDGNTKTFTVTNIATTDANKTQVNVVKRWDDANNQDGIRPNLVSVRLLANGEDTGKVMRLAASNAWAGSFRGLDKTSSDGAAIVYTVEEDAVDGYEASVTGDVTAGYVVTNTHVSETVTVAGSKTWDDNDDAEGARPASITIRLSANGTEVASRNVTAADDWAWSFADLPACKNGNRIQYTIAEDTVSDYSSHVEGYDVVNTYAPGKTQVQVHHIWDDQNDACGLRPNHVVVHLLANGKDTGLTLVLGERPSLRAAANAVQNDTWSGTFDNLDIYDKSGQPIVYTVSQSEVDYYKHSESGNASQGFTLVDAHDPETITLKGTKTWDDSSNEDGSRPAGVLIRLYADGVEDTSRAVYLTSSYATDADTWAWKIDNLPKYYGFESDGKEHEIKYTITEDATPGYSATIPENGTLMPKTDEPDELAFNVTNKHVPWTTDVRVVKVWNDDENRDGIRPDSVTVKLLANGSDAHRTVVLNETSNWEGVFDGLSTENGVVYTVEEQKTDVITGTDGTGTYATSMVGNAERGFTITNTHTPDKVNIAVTKVWDDNNNQDGLRPRSVSISLLANGKRVDGRVVSNEDASANEWSWEFTNKPKYDGVDESGKPKEIVYTVTENPVEHYNALVAGNAKDGFTITNTHVPGVRNVEGYKLWVDGSDQDGVRPKSVTVRLLADGKEVAHKTLTAGDQGINANVWEYSFKSVPVWSDGHEIDYSVVEDAVEGYDTSYDGLNITNMHTPETVDVAVSKAWLGDEDNEATHQQVVYVQLRANNRVVSYCELSEANGWAHTFAGVPKNENGKQISYTVSEKLVDNYTSSVEGNASDGYTITNEYTPGKTQVNVYKVWDDDDNRDRIRPTEIEVRLLADGADTNETRKLNADNGWAGSFDQLPMHKELEGGGKGDRIQYSVQEVSVEGYGVQTNGTMYEGFSLINRHEPELVSIIGAKTWIDNDNAAGLRPESIRIRLKANGDDVNGRRVDEGDGWAWDFTRLPKFDAGQEIAYSISEDAVDSYETTYDGYNVTNTYLPDIKSIKVTKKWNDSSNADGVRPDSVTVHLYADSVDTGLAYTLSDANKTDDNTWTLEATDLNLPATKEGHAISYALKEDAVDGYTSGVTGNITEGFVVTNTHEVAPVPDRTMYTITYDLNGGSYKGSTDNIVEKYPAGTGILIHEAPTREGYTFEYWKGSEYQPGDAYTVTEDHTFVAQWKPNGGDKPSEPASTDDKSPAGGAGRTTSAANLARTGDDSTLALVGVAIALLGTSALALARRRR